MNRTFFMQGNLKENYHKIIFGFSIFRVFRNLTFHYAIMVSFYLSIGLSVAQIGWLEAAYWGTKLFSDVPSGYAADRYGHRRGLYIGNALIIASLTLLVFSTSFSQCVAAQIIVAMGHSLTAVSDSAGCRQSLLNLIIASKYRVAESVGTASRNFSLFVGVNCGAILLHFYGLRGLFILSIGAIAAAIATVHLFCPHHDAENRQVSGKSKRERGSQRQDFSGKLWISSLAIAYSCLYFIEFFSIPFTQVLLGEKGFSSDSIAMLFSFLLLGSGVASTVISRLSLSFGVLITFILIAVLIHGIFLVILVENSWSYALFLLTYSGFMVGKGAYIPIIRSEILRTADPARASAVLGFISMLGGATLFFLSPVIFDLISQKGSIAGAIVILAVGVTGALVMLIGWLYSRLCVKTKIVPSTVSE
ncbi:MFS transporter [Rahnella sikkimica]|uniref:Major facilitator superfamily (MFS) profile domain-containing protein n=1 Tax=Rahnella sikkimica TaxID=1805933 RepID=A0A2L1UZ27_9GAMM|nr:MFS transporter [Rahnella sikkimica]AVF38098.1 hypothetical protein BV494_24695 [Rahnella sikkimica]